jgi:hypothetical protein
MLAVSKLENLHWRGLVFHYHGHASSYRFPILSFLFVFLLCALLSPLLTIKSGLEIVLDDLESSNDSCLVPNTTLLSQAHSGLQDLHSIMKRYLS